MILISVVVMLLISTVVVLLISNSCSVADILMCVCMSVSVCLSVCLSIYLSIYTSTHTNTHTHIHTYIHTYINVYTYARTHTRIHLNTHTHTHTLIYPAKANSLRNPSVASRLELLNVKMLTLESTKIKKERGYPEDSGSPFRLFVIGLCAERHDSVTNNKRTHHYNRLSRIFI